MELLKTPLIKPIKLKYNHSLEYLKMSRPRYSEQTEEK